MKYIFKQDEMQLGSLTRTWTIWQWLNIRIVKSRNKDVHSMNSKKMKRFKRDKTPLHRIKNNAKAWKMMELYRLYGIVPKEIPVTMPVDDATDDNTNQMMSLATEIVKSFERAEKVKEIEKSGIGSHDDHLDLDFAIKAEPYPNPFLPNNLHKFGFNF